MALKDIRKETVSLESYVKKVKNGDVIDNQDVQRLFCWDDLTVGELIVSVLNNDYIPPLIIGEIEMDNGTVLKYIIDGLQRSTSFYKFQFANIKISHKVENPIVEYQVKAKDENGRFLRDEDGNFVYEIMQFDVRNKTFSELPEELQEVFKDYQIELAVHQRCTMKTLSKYVRKYNNHISMKTSQKAFTFLDNYARRVREIANNEFFKNSMDYSEKYNRVGEYEKIVSETIMIMNFRDSWRTQLKDINKYINKNASMDMIEEVNDLTTQLYELCDDRYIELFSRKNASFWICMYGEFLNYGLNEEKFIDFIDIFTDKYGNEMIDDEKTYNELDEYRHSKNKKYINLRCEFVMRAMEDFFGVNGNVEEPVEETEEVEVVTTEEVEDEHKQHVDCMTDDEIFNTLHDIFNKEETTEDFLSKVLERECDSIDVQVYEMALDDYTLEVDNRSKLLDDANKKSLVGIVGYSFDMEIEEEKFLTWFVKYFDDVHTYNSDPYQNYAIMKNSLDEYIKENVA